MRDQPELDALLSVLERRYQEALEAQRLLTERILLLRRAKESLVFLIEAGGTSAVDSNLKVDPRVVQAAVSDPEQAVLGAQFVIRLLDEETPEQKLNPIKRRRPRVSELDPAGSTARAATIVNDLGRPVTVVELVAEFSARGWSEATWSRPDDAVAQAARRAANRGLIRQLRDKRFTPVAAVNTVDLREQQVIDLRERPGQPDETWPEIDLTHLDRPARRQDPS